MNKIVNLFLFFIPILFINDLTAQKEIKWGKVEMEYLKMTSYDRDPTADAVILSNTGRFILDPTGNSYEYHVRIKILNENALHLANVELPYSKGENKIVNVKAQTIKLNSRGKVEKIPVDKKLIFDGKKSDTEFLKKFSFPKVEVGSIIEYKYFLHYNRGGDFKINPWYFQTDLPTIYSEYQGGIESEYKGGNYREDIKDRDLRYDTQEGVGALQNQSYTFLLNQSHKVEMVEENIGDKAYFTWYSIHVPAMKEDGFITTMEDHYTKIRFQLNAVSIGGVTMPNMASWKKVNEELANMSQFGECMTWGVGTLSATVKELTAGLESDDEKMKAIYDYVTNQVEWNGNYALLVDNTMSVVDRNGVGNSAEVNFLLTTMLRMAELDAHPVMVSTRSHGKVYKEHTFVNQFNHVISAVYFGSKYILLDATNPLAPYDVLPFADLNGEGFLVSNEEFQWVELDTKKTYNHSCIGQFSLSPDGTISGSFAVTDKDYAAVESRTKFKNAKNESEFAKDLLKGLPNLEVTDFQSENIEDVYEPFNYQISLNTLGYSSVKEDQIFFKPMMIDGEIANPFKAKTRAYPITYPYPVNNNFVLTIDIPEGYEIEKIPENEFVVLGRNSGEFKYYTAVKENTIQLSCKVSIRDKTFEAKHYEDLQDFYNLIIKKQAEEIVFKKL